LVAHRFEELEVFQRAYKLSLDIHRFTLTMPQIEQYALAGQLRRASKSICANLAEGFGKQSLSRPEFRRFIVMSMGSADEMRVWLRYCRDLEYLDVQRWERWRAEYEALAKMLQGLSKSVG
jgi:four helix bundle protein